MGADNIAIDWKHIWNGTHNLAAYYGVTELRTPPWALIFVWPLTLLSLERSWALAAYLTLVVLSLSAPQSEGRGERLLGTLLLVAAYPALRQLIDGNLEALIIGGALLLAYSLARQKAWPFALSLLLLSAKIQETWLLLPFAIYQQWRSWPRAERLKPYLYSGAIAALPLLIYGGGWVEAMVSFPWPGTLIDAGLSATMQRLGLPMALYWALWMGAMGALIYLWSAGRLGAERASYALLITAALLLGPYAASNTALTPFALGVIPLALVRPLWGLPLAGLYYLPYLMLGDAEWRFGQESNYWTLVLGLTFLALLWDVWKGSDSPHQVSSSIS